MTVLGRIVVAREALEVGDDSLAYDVLVDLEHDLASCEASRAVRKFRCRCGAAFRWPGELQHHQYAACHGALPMEDAA